MQAIKDLIIDSASGKPVLLDFYLHPHAKKQPIVLFAHGFKGFKDWGHWGLLAQHFAQAGFAFLPFNFSHNGTSPEHPKDFVDLEAFGQNSYSKELADIDAVLEWLERAAAVQFGTALDIQKIALIGHSRGGGTGIIKAQQDERISALLTWASVSRLDFMWHDKPALLESWKEDGVLHILNGRTKQQMPLYYQLVEDFDAHRAAWDTAQAMRKLHKACLIIHGNEDPAVPLSAAYELQSYNENAQLHIIEGANHVFGGAHPFGAETLPPTAEELLQASLDFFRTWSKA